MSFHARRRLPASATFFDRMTVELTGNGKGYGASIEVEIEFTATPAVGATWDHPAEGDEREIIAVRPFRWKINPTTGRNGTMREYLPSCSLLDEMLRDCIDVDALHVDWSDI